MKSKDRQPQYQKYIINPKNYKIVQQLESGGYGSVFSVQNIETGNIIAAKTITNHQDEDQYKRMINREIRIMIKCQHPTIIKFYGYSLLDFNDQKNAIIFMDLAKNGSLVSLLQKVQNGLLDNLYDNTTRQIILVGIAYGMMHLHKHQIIHRDLKPGNILLDDDFHPHITDFGLSKIYEGGNSTSQSQQCGTSIYMAPEVIESTHYSSKADVYSFGILMYQVVTDSMPYPVFEKGKMSSFQFTNKVVNEDYRPKFTVPIKKSIQKLIEKCWSKNPHERPTFEEIFKKLAYNEEPSDEIIDTSESEDDDENKYYLENVDIDEVLLYADEIDFSDEKGEESGTIDQSKVTELIEKMIAPLRKENEELKRQIDQIQKEKEEMKTRISSLEKAQSNGQTAVTKSDNLEQLKDQINTQISIKNFNNLLMNEQQEIVSCLCSGKMSQYFTKINNILLLLIKFIKDDKQNLVKIVSEDDEQLLNHLETEKIVQISWQATEILTKLNLINSPDLNNILLQFNWFSFEVKFNTSIYDQIYNILVKKKNINIYKFQIAIFIDEEVYKSDFFKEQTAINAVRFSQALKEIASDAFTSCTNLTTVELPKSLQKIGCNAFRECESLAEIHIPSSVEEIGNGSFYSCSSLKRVIFDEIENSVLSVIDSLAFISCTALEEFTFPPSLARIGDCSFYMCKSLKKVSIPKSVTQIGEQCFFYCSSLELAEIHSTCCKIGSCAFPSNTVIVKP